MLLLCGFLPRSIGDDGEFHLVDARSRRPVEGGFGFCAAVVDGDDDEKNEADHLYTWGSAPFPPSSPPPSPVAAAASGYDHVVVASEGGDSVWFCGWGGGVGAGGGGQTREGRRWSLLPLPPESGRVSSLSCGFDRTLALTSDGSLWEWGGGESGGEWGGGESGGAREVDSSPRRVERERGSGTRSERRSEVRLPRRVEFPTPSPLSPSPTAPVAIRSVSAGARHCAAVDSLGSLWTWGCNLRGQCGVAPSSSPSRRRPPLSLPRPTRNETLGGVRLVAVAAGGAHTLALSESGGSLFGFGCNGSGQLGDGRGEGEEPPPPSMPVPAQLSLGASEEDSLTLVSISAGASHSLVLASEVRGEEETRSVFVLGRVSPPASTSASSPSFAPPRRVALPTGARPTAIASGWWHAAISVEGEAEGRNERTAKRTRV